MSRIAYVGVLVAGAVLTVVGLAGAGPEAVASGDDARVCAAAWCPKESPGWRSPEARGEPTTTKSTTTTVPYTTTTTTTTTTTSTTTTTTKPPGSTPPSSTTSTTTTTTSPGYSTTPPSSTTPPGSTTSTTTPPRTTPSATTPPVTKPPVYQDNRLASTGASATWTLLLGVLLLVGGTALLLLDRARSLTRR